MNLKRFGRNVIYRDVVHAACIFTWPLITSVLFVWLGLGVVLFLVFFLNSKSEIAHKKHKN